MGKSETARFESKIAPVFRPTVLKRKVFFLTADAVLIALSVIFPFGFASTAASRRRSPKACG